jgi:hypothetical protein
MVYGETFLRNFKFYAKTLTKLHDLTVSTLWGKLIIRRLTGGIMTGSGAIPPCPRRTRRGRPPMLLLPLMMVFPSRYRSVPLVNLLTVLNCVADLGSSAFLTSGSGIRDG